MFFLPVPLHDLIYYFFCSLPQEACGEEGLDAICIRLESASGDMQLAGNQAQHSFAEGVPLALDFMTLQVSSLAPWPNSRHSVPVYVVFPLVLPIVKSVGQLRKWVDKSFVYPHQLEDSPLCAECLLYHGDAIRQ